MKSLKQYTNAGRSLLFYCCFIFLLMVCQSSFVQETHFSDQRIHMVKTQIQSRGITDKNVIDALLKVERHKFVLPEYISMAYNDSPLPIDEGQTISQPYIVAFMTEALRLNSTDKVLEIGTGSGYQTAIIAEICQSVYSIEIFESLGEKAEQLFNELGYSNIKCKIGDGYEGWQQFAPFDAIIVTCSPTHIPQPLKNQLAEGGKMIIPVGKYPFQNLVLLRKKNGRIRETKVLPVRFVPMISAEGKSY